MLIIRDALIDDTVKPAIEWIHGRAVQKLMPTDLHGILQFAFAKFLAAWARAQGPIGKVIPEWRFIVPPNSYKTKSVVPDVAYLATYFELPKGERTYPTIPPDIAVEIPSPDNQPKDVEGRRDFYLWWGVKLILIADPIKRTVKAYESATKPNSYSENDTLMSRAFSTLVIPLRECFAELDEPA